MIHTITRNGLTVDVDLREDGSCRGVNVRVATDTGVLTVRAIRDLQLGSIIEQFSGEIREANPDVKAAIDLLLKPSPDASARYARVANAHLKLTSAGHPRPAGYIADLLGVSLSTVRQRVAFARTRGLLSQTTKGVPGGELTPRGVELLGGP